MKNHHEIYLTEEYFNIKQENEISEQINSEGGNQPIREDHRADIKKVKETMTKTDENSNLPKTSDEKTN